ncbi:MAG: mitomycin antibiotic biosynthesis protein [Chromatiales bacterium]|jgi:ectoine hydroxylase-related dioxygenase (phytanoyl-CoA dioxygenase family)|nr:mitomycin antibiotic biosynthesis protein [Chromatiales bacterium]
MTQAALQSIDAEDGTDAIRAVLECDGGVIVHNALSAAQVDGLNADLEQQIRATAPGIAHPTHQRMADFYGTDTIRIDGLPAKSEAFVDVMLSSPLLGLADQILLPSCEDYLFNTGQLIQIGPGESAQAIHRDEDAWSYLPRPAPLLQVEGMFALSDFREENGATQVVPGSHLWEHDRTPRSDEITQACMPAGSALIYLGATLHGGGANRTADEWRRGMFMGFVVGWLRAEENAFLTVPIERARELPRRAQELLGYKAHMGIGVVDVGDPMVLLQ